MEEDHPDSNARLIREALLINEAASAQFVSLKIPSTSPFGVEQQVSNRLGLFAAGIDVVVLGMGEDGHTASFFSGAETLDRALAMSGEDLCVAIRPPRAPHLRMTLSLAALLRARHCYLHITGEKKLEVLERAMCPGDLPELPIRSVLRSRHFPVEIYYANRS